MLRKQTAISHNLEDSILGIRPISAAFIYHCEHDILAVQDGVSAVSLRLLAQIAGDNRQGDNSEDDTDLIPRSMLSCPFITGDLMFPESDRSYLEARRLALTQNHLKRKIRLHGVSHTLALTFLLLLSIIDIIVGILPYSGCSYQTVNHYMWFYILEVIEIFTSFCFSLWVFLPKFCLTERVGLYRQPSLLYRHTTILLIYYPVILCTSIIQFILFYLNTFEAQYMKRYMYGGELLQIIQAVNCIIPIIIILHISIFCCMSECKFRVHRWEWIFIDFLCRKNYLYFNMDDDVSEIDRDGDVVETNVVPDTAGINTVDERTPLLSPVR